MKDKDHEIERLKCRIAKLEKYLLHLMRATGQISMMVEYNLESKNRNNVSNVNGNRK